jgi:hypothetical protein
MRHTAKTFKKLKVPHNRPKGLEGVEVQLYSFFNLVLEVGGWSAPLLLCTHSTGGWVGPRAGLDVREKSRFYQDLIPGSSSP